MGKGQIINNLGEGRYSIQLLRDMRAINARRSWFDASLIALEPQRIAQQAVVDGLEQDVLILIDDLNVLIAAKAEIKTLVEKTTEIISKNLELQQEKVKLGMLRAKIESLTKYKAQLLTIDNLIDGDVRTVWCADLSIGLTGTQQTIEINGVDDTVLLLPAVHPDVSSVYTGDLAPVLPMTVAQTAFNFAVHDGWQKWQPTYRTGKITVITGDSATVLLDAAQSRYISGNINQSSTVTATIKYMTCDGDVFAVDDEVVVMFTGQAWENPVVIGFMENPKPCTAKYIVILSSPSGNEAFAWDILNDELIAAKATLTDIQSIVGSGNKLVPSGVIQVTASSGATGYDPGYDMPLYDDDWVAAAPYVGKFNTRIITGGWQFDALTEFEYPYIENPDDSEDKKGAYYIAQLQALLSKSTFNSSVGWTGATHEVNTNIPSKGWLDRDYIDRHQLFHRPLFGLDLSGIQAHPINCNNIPYYFHKIYDEWDDDVTTVNYTSDHYVPEIPAGNEVGGPLMGNGTPFNEDKSWSNEESATYVITYELGDVIYLPGHPFGYKGALPHYSVFWDNAGIANIQNDSAVMEQNIIHGDFLSNATMDLIDPPGHSKRMIRLYLKRENPLTGIEKEIWNLVNAEKITAGQPEVIFNQALYEAAKRHADNLAAVGAEYWTCPAGSKCQWPAESMPAAEHYGSDGSYVTDRVIDAGYDAHIRYWDASWNLVDTYYDATYAETSLKFTEIVAHINLGETAEDCVDWWMSSVTHRDKILNVGVDPPFAESGLAVASSASYTYIVQVFGYRGRIWPGFSGRRTENLIDYMDSNFNWTEIEDKKQLPEIYFL